MKINCSVVVSAFNEEKRLQACLESVSFAREIIVVDNSSWDKTASIAKKNTKLVFKQPNHLMLNRNKNYGFEKANSDWILNLDADEVVTPALEAQIKKVIESDKNSADSPVGYWIPRKNILFGQWIKHGLWWPDKQLRLFRRNQGRFPCKHIHEYLKVNGNTAELTEPYLHYNYDSIAQYLTKLERCTDSEAIQLKESGYRLSWQDAIRFPVSDFLKIYFAQSGYKDGLHGLILAILQAFYSFVTFTKLWEAEKFPRVDLPVDISVRELSRAHQDVVHWETQTLLLNNPVNPWFLKLKRKILSVLG